MWSHIFRSSILHIILSGVVLYTSVVICMQFTAAAASASFKTYSLTLSTVTVNVDRSLQSHNQPNHYLRHRDLLGFISAISTELDKQDATFRIISGLANNTCISFQSFNYPTHYLRHQDFRIKLSAWEDTDLFHQDATFCPRVGLADATKVSFESLNIPGYFLRHTNFELYIQQGSDDLFKADATFSMVEPLATIPQLPLNSDRSLQSHNQPNHYVRHRDLLGFISEVSTELDKQDATFKLISGLADSHCVSFQSFNYPSHYLRHQDFRIKLHPSEDNDLFRADATFCPRVGLADATKISFESLNMPQYFLRHTNFELYMQQGGDDLFKADATFTFINSLADSRVYLPLVQR